MSRLGLSANDSGKTNKRRAVQLVTLPTTDGPPVNILHTHLSAFASGDGTVEEQVGVLRSLMARQLLSLLVEDGHPAVFLPGRLRRVNLQLHVAPPLDEICEVGRCEGE